MAELAEHDSGTAARILAAARDLVLKRGVKGLTVAEIAEKAHVGKGTPTCTGRPRTSCCSSCSLGTSWPRWTRRSTH
jgi:hypothetical protein